MAIIEHVACIISGFQIVFHMQNESSCKCRHQNWDWIGTVEKLGDGRRGTAGYGGGGRAVWRRARTLLHSRTQKAAGGGEEAGSDSRRGGHCHKGLNSDGCQSESLRYVFPNSR